MELYWYYIYRFFSCRFFPTGVMDDRPCGVPSQLAVYRQYVDSAGDVNPADGPIDITAGTYQYDFCCYYCCY